MAVLIATGVHWDRSIGISVNHVHPMKSFVKLHFKTPESLSNLASAGYLHMLLLSIGKLSSQTRTVSTHF